MGYSPRTEDIFSSARRPQAQTNFLDLWPNVHNLSTQCPASRCSPRAKSMLWKPAKVKRTQVFHSLLFRQCKTTPCLNWINKAVQKSHTKAGQSSDKSLIVSYFFHSKQVLGLYLLKWGMKRVRKICVLGASQTTSNNTQRGWVA